jgi:hypothetical protein
MNDIGNYYSYKEIVTKELGKGGMDYNMLIGRIRKVLKKCQNPCHAMNHLL